MVRVSIVARLTTIRAGLRAMIESQDDLIVAGEASSISDASVLAPKWAADILVFASDTSEQAQADMETAVVYLLPDGLPFTPPRAGPWGALRDDADAEKLSSAIRAVANGLVVYDSLLEPPRPAHAGPAETAALTPREMEVLQRMADGASNKEIAHRLTIGENTVKYHVASILTKLGAASRAEAVALGMRQGLIRL